MQDLGAGNDPTQPIVRHYCHQTLGHTEQSNPVRSFTGSDRQRSNISWLIYILENIPSCSRSSTDPTEIQDLEFFLIPTLVSAVCILQEKYLIIVTRTELN